MYTYLLEVGLLFKTVFMKRITIVHPYSSCPLEGSVGFTLHYLFRCLRTLQYYSIIIIIIIIIVLLL